MAQKPDIAAAKARKQKIILVVAGVALVGMAVIQVPKLMKGGSQPVAVAAAPVAAATTSPAAAVMSPTTRTFKPAAYVAGVALPGGTTVVVAKSQLVSFTLFDAKDPFVQQVGDGTGAAQAAAPAAAVTETAPPATGEPAPASAAGTSTPPPAPVIYATVMFNGKPQQLQVKQKFPKGDPLFVLVSLKKQQAKIGVAGGSFENGQNVTLTLGKKLTLLDTATGVRYELKLVYTGATPEQIEGFSTAAPPAPPAAGTAAGTAGGAAVVVTP
jgi:hypothetical protein